MAQSAPGTAKTTADAPLQTLTAPHPSTGTVTRSLPDAHDSSAPYSALPNDFFLLKCTSGVRRESRSNERPLPDARPRKDALPRQDLSPCTTVTHIKYVFSKIRMTDLPVLNPWSQICSVPLTGLLAR